MSEQTFLQGLTKHIQTIFSAKVSDTSATKAKAENKGCSDRGFLSFANTGEVIRAERHLKECGFAVEVKGPPPNMHTGCDMVILFPLMLQVSVLENLRKINLTPLQVVTEQDNLLEPVSLFQHKQWEHWLMVRAANLKITIDTNDQRIVNISGGGCPDVPYLAHCLCGQILDHAPEPLSIGQTLCCYSLQKAFDEARRILQCGS